jgi:hypothetical protein
VSTITIRGLSDEVRDELKGLAALNNRSMEAEARADAILAAGRRLRDAGGPVLTDDDLYDETGAPR